VTVQREPEATSRRQRILILAVAGLGLASMVATGLVSLSTGRLPGAGQAVQITTAPAPTTLPPARDGRAPTTTSPGAAEPGATSPGAAEPGGPETSGAAPADPPPVVAALTAKDPFRPVVASSPGTTGGGAGSSDGAQAPATTVPGAGSGTATTPGGGSTTTRKVTLLDVLRRSGTRYAKVKVEAKTYQVKEGQAFAGSYKAVDIGTSCAEFLSGGTAFTLCKGEAVLK